MGREVRRVPKNWAHPKEWTYGFHGPEYRFKRLYPGEHYQPTVDEWEAERVQWEAGVRPTFFTEEEGYAAMEYEEYAGQRPCIEDYMPNWPEEERTHLMMYETTSGGTPISPAFETPEELARWLTDNNAPAFGYDTADYESWLSVAREGWTPSAVQCGGGEIISGVAALAAKE